MQLLCFIYQCIIFVVASCNATDLCIPFKHTTLNFPIPKQMTQITHHLFKINLYCLEEDPKPMNPLGDTGTEKAGKEKL